MSEELQGRFLISRSGKNWNSRGEAPTSSKLGVDINSVRCKDVNETFGVPRRRNDGFQFTRLFCLTSHFHRSDSVGCVQLQSAAVETGDLTLKMNRGGGGLTVSEMHHTSSSRGSKDTSTIRLTAIGGFVD